MMFVVYKYNTEQGFDIKMGAFLAESDAQSSVSRMEDGRRIGPYVYYYRGVDELDREQISIIH